MGPFALPWVPRVRPEPAYQQREHAACGRRGAGEERRNLVRNLQKVGRNFECEVVDSPEQQDRESSYADAEYPGGLRGSRRRLKEQAPRKVRVLEHHRASALHKVG